MEKSAFSTLKGLSTAISEQTDTASVEGFINPKVKQGIMPEVICRLDGNSEGIKDEIARLYDIIQTIGGEFPMDLKSSEDTLTASHMDRLLTVYEKNRISYLMLRKINERLLELV